MKKNITILILITFCSILLAQESILVDFIHGADYMLTMESGLPERIDFENLFPEYTFDYISKENITLTEVLVEESVNGPLNYSTTVDLPDAYYPENPIALYVIITDDTGEVLSNVVGTITNPTGEIVAEIFNRVGHYDNALGNGWQIDLSFNYPGSYDIKIGYGPYLFQSSGIEGQINLNNYDAFIRIKDYYYYAFTGISPDFASTDINALDEAFSNGLNMMNVYNLFDGFMDKPFVHFDSNTEIDINYSIDIPGTRTIVQPEPEINRNNISWNNHNLQQRSDNEIIYELIMNDKLNFLHFDYIGTTLNIKNQVDYPLNYLQFIKYESKNTYRYYKNDQINENESISLTESELYTTQELKNLLKSNFFNQAIKEGLTQDETDHFVNDFIWIESLLRRALDNPEHIFGLYHFNGELYDRLVPYEIQPVPQKASRNMWVMLSNIQNREMENPIKLNEIPIFKKTLEIADFEMREYGILDEFYSHKNSSREDEFFGIQLSEYINGWTTGNYNFYENPLAVEISEGIENLEHSIGHYGFIIDNPESNGIIYDSNYPENPIGTGLAINENGRLILLGTGEFFDGNGYHDEFLNNCLNSLIDGNIFVGNTDQTGYIGKAIRSTTYPNPFIKSNNERSVGITIQFELPEKTSNTTISIFNLKGEKVKDIQLSESEQFTNNTVTWDGKDKMGKEVSTGLYFYKIRAGKFTTSKKFIIMK